MQILTTIPLVAAVMGLSACDPGVSPPVEEAFSASAATATEVRGVRDGRTSLAVGQTLTVALPSNATTGYRWQVEGLEDGVLTPGTPFGDEITDSHAPGMVGVGGHTVWTFRAVRAGETTLTFTYSRSWERDTPPAETATYTITVR